MTESRDIQSILAALAAQRPPAAASTPTQSQPGLPMPSYPTHSPQPPAPYGGLPPGGYALPQPASTGSLDLSSIRPAQSGSVSIADAVEKAKAYAAERGVASYDRPLVYAPGSDPRGPDPRFGRDRSRSPPRGGGGGGGYRDASNPYRDERRGPDYRDRSYSPPPRDRDRNFGRGSNGRRGSPRGEESSETIQIESSLVGLIIGHKGENLRRIENDTECRVQFLAAQNGDASNMRQCKITGPRQRRAEVKAAIDRIIDDNGMGVINRQVNRGRDGGKSGAGALRDGEDHMKIMVPDRTVGLIIGRGGETIRDLQERSGCHINIVGESKSVNGLRPVNLIGSPEAAAKAKELILEIVDSDSRVDQPPARGQRSNGPQDRGGNMAGGGAGGDKVNDTMYVPSDAVGMIIGKGGETIRQMQDNTGCKINVAQSSGPGELEREIGLVGSRDSIMRAKMAIEEKVDAVRQKSGGGGGGGGGRGRTYQDSDRANYGQSYNGPPTNQPAAQHGGGGGAAGAGGGGEASDPYAMYGGYQKYMQAWYALVAAQQGGQAGAAAAPPGQ